VLNITIMDTRTKAIIKSINVSRWHILDLDI
jgi:hypothetical protein